MHSLQFCITHWFPSPYFVVTNLALRICTYYCKVTPVTSASTKSLFLALRPLTFSSYDDKMTDEMGAAGCTHDRIDSPMHAGFDGKA